MFDFGPFFVRIFDAPDGKTYMMNKSYLHELRGKSWPDYQNAPTWPRNSEKISIMYSHKKLAIMRSYAWNGASGPTIDTTSSIRASCVHDALYDLMVAGILDARYHRRLADREFRLILKEDGMNFIRRWYWWLAVRLFAAGRAKP